MRFPTLTFLILIPVIILNICGCATVAVVQETGKTAGSQSVQDVEDPVKPSREDILADLQGKPEENMKEQPVDKSGQLPRSQSGIGEKTGEEMKEDRKSVELIKLADSQEEAEKIAKTYGIELVEFSFGVAGFHTDEDPEEVISRGKENGWPELSRNSKRYLYNEKGNYQLY